MMHYQQQPVTLIGTLKLCHVVSSLQLCQVLLAEGYDVLATCRSTSPELDATSAKVVEGEADSSRGIQLTAHSWAAGTQITSQGCNMSMIASVFLPF